MADLHELARQLGPSLGRSAAYLDLADALRALIVDGQIVVGDRLPPQRALADALGVSRSTVVAALTLLHAEGYLASRQGSATTVRLPVEDTDRPDEDRRGETMAGRPADIDLSIAVLPAPRQVAAAAVRAAARLPEHLGGHGLHPFGLSELRSAIAHRFTTRGLPTDAEQILVTQGALHAWDLVLRALARPANSVLVEQPSYPAAVDAVRAHRLRLRPLTVSAGGWQWPSDPPPAQSLAFVVTDFHNPTGHFADDGARRTLARRLRATQLCIDETFAELGDADGPRALPTASYARDAVTIGSVSKLVWGGLRIGWLRAPRGTIRRIAAARSSQDIAAPVLDQLLVLELMDDLDSIRDERRELLRERRRSAAAAVRAAEWQVTEPAGGMFLWVDLQGLSSTRLSAAARERGVRVPPGTRFSLNRTHDRYLRIPLTPAPSQLSAAMSRLLDAASDGDVRLDPARGAVWTV